MLLLNAVMITSYVRAMSRAGTVVTTVTNTGVNIGASSVLGYLMFQESLTVKWLVGAALTLFGVLIIQRSQEESTGLSRSALKPHAKSE